MILLGPFFSGLIMSLVCIALSSFEDNQTIILTWHAFDKFHPYLYKMINTHKTIYIKLLHQRK
jgi:hypothetical protein